MLRNSFSSQSHGVAHGSVLFYPGEPKGGDAPGVEYADHGDNEVLAATVESMRWVVPPGATTVACIPARDDIGDQL